jgi:AraC-like DNA-binding protein
MPSALRAASLSPRHPIDLVNRSKETLPQAKSASRIEWLLHEGEAERRVPSSERIVINDDHVRTTTERIDISSGMRVFLTSAEVRRPLTVTAPHSAPGPWLAANVAARGRIDLEMTDGQRATIDADRSVLFRSADKVSRYTSLPGEALRLAGYMIRADRAEHIFGGALPEAIRPLARRTARESVVIATPADAGQRRLAASLFTEKLHGPMRAIFMEGVALQLFAMQTAAASATRSDEAPADRVSQGERAGVEAARELLLADMRAPPTLAELASRVGISEKALNAGFRLVYGATVFEVLRNERLEHARLALETTASPMKSIAFRVGYNHVTNFISAFTRRYGMPPVRFMRGRSGEGDPG